MNNSTLIEDLNTSLFNDSTNATTCTACRGPMLSPIVFLTYNIYLSLSLILGTIGNGLVLLVFIKYKVSTSTDWFIIFISIFDLISSLVNLPIYLTFTTGTWQKIGNDIFCKLHMFISQSVVLSSTFLICGLAIERYLKICHRNGCRISKTRAFYICLTITVATCLMSVPCFQMFKNIQGQCVASSLDRMVFIYYLLVLCTYILAFFVVSFSYTRITIVVLKSESNVSRHTNNAVDDSNSSCFCRRGRNRVVPSVVPSGSSVSHDDDGSRSLQQNGSDKTAGTHLQVPKLSTHTKTTEVTITAVSSVSGAFAEPSLISRADNGNHSSWKTTVPKQRSNQGRKTTRITFAVCLIFIVSWLPPWIAFVLFSQPDTRIDPYVLGFGLFGKMTYLFNTFMNPILYLSMNRKFREQAWSLFCCSKRGRNRVVPSVVPSGSSVSHDDDGTRSIQENGSDKTAGTHLQVPKLSTHTKTTEVTITAVSSVSGAFAEPSLISRADNGNHSSGKTTVPKQRSNQGRKTTRITFAVCLIVIVSWLPPWIAFVLFSQPGTRIDPYVLGFGLFGKMTYLFNTFMNPILYLSMNRKFREQTWSLFCCSK